MLLRRTQPMKQSDWEYLARNMWTYAKENNGRMQSLIFELVSKINQNKGIIVDEE